MVEVLCGRVNEVQMDGSFRIYKHAAFVQLQTQCISSMKRAPGKYTFNDKEATPIYSRKSGIKNFNASIHLSHQCHYKIYLALFH